MEHYKFYISENHDEGVDYTFKWIIIVRDYGNIDIITPLTL